MMTSEKCHGILWGENYCMENPASGLESVKKLESRLSTKIELSHHVMLLVAGKIVWSCPLPVLYLLSLPLLLQLWVPHPSQHPLHTAREDRVYWDTGPVQLHTKHTQTNS